MLKSWFNQTLIIILFQSALISQSYLGVQTNNTHIGYNVGLYYSKNFNKNQITLGLTHLIDNIPDYDNSWVFRNQAYGRTLIERLGLNIAYSHELYKYNDFTFSVGYHFFYTRPGFRSLFFSPAGIIEDTQVYKRILVDFLPADVLEHYISGFGCFKIANRLSLSTKAGLGFATFYNLDEKLAGGLAPNKWWGQETELSTSFSLGLAYSIN